ncbi:uncharacterized protein BDW70DRAFT_132386 [Aspergillus foveolatus]|uniref:uncharacterized protein n=1 Tax=Aspergillus foveolatus TaxID=210207 RepID=UPI003CCCD23F
MSRHTPPTDALGKESDWKRATTPQDASGLFNTLQGHVDDIRSLLQCGICIRPLYEPFTIACGHTFCYGCLTSWFAEGKNNKTCPDCRAPVKSQPAPAYLVRAVVQLFTSRAELLDKGETTEQHIAHQNEEAERLEADKKNKDPKEGGLFRGIFNQTRQRPAQPIYDLEDGVVRCPYCAHELEADDCLNCGYRNDDSMSDFRSDSEENSEMTDDPYAEIDDDGFGEAPGSDSAEWYDDDLTPENYPGIQRLPTGFRLQSFPGFGNVPGGMARAFYEHFHGHSDFDSHGSTHEDDDDDEMDDEEDEDMDSFIDDEEQPEDYDSDSDRDTVVGRSEYGGAQLRTTLDSSPGSRYSSAQSNIYDFDTVLDSDEDGMSDEDEDEDGNEHEDEELEDDDEDGDEDDDDDDDDDEEPIRPSVARSRRTTYQILSSSSPLRVNSAAATSTCSRPQPPAAGLSAASAISLDDDSDEGPVGPATRRARARPAAA